MASDQPDVSVLIPAAGRGLRLGGQRKQFRPLAGRPLLIRTVELFHLHQRVSSIVLAVPSDYLEDVRLLLSRDLPQARVIVVQGGESRRESVANALASAPPESEVILVHDAVRPFVPRSLIDDVIDGTRRYGAAAAALPVTDTLRRGEMHVFGETVRRQGLWRVQTPQGFRRPWLEAGHRLAAREGTDATDDVDLVQQAGFEVQIIEGVPWNIKITTNADWKLAEKLCEMGEVRA